MSESMSPSSTADDVEALPNIDDIEESAIVKEDVVKDGEDDEDPFANHENLPESPFKGRPLGWNSALEQSVYYYAPNPLMFSVIFLLTLMVLDRTVMWGTTYTNVPFLTGFYNGSWNPNMGASQAAMFSSSAMIVAYITPFFTALLADGLFGDFSTILILMVLFSLPGLILMVLAAWPELLGSIFNKDVMRVGMLILYPIGNGGMNTLNDMFSAKQYHPVSQKAEVEKYFVERSCIRVCAPWFENKTGDNPSNISSTEYYVEAQVWKFFLVMAGWGLLLVLLGFFPPMKWWTDYMEGLSDPEKYKKDVKAEDDNGSSSDHSAPNRRATMESDEQQVVADELLNEAEPESEQ